jgi:hypothetical protein
MTVNATTPEKPRPHEVFTPGRIPIRPRNVYANRGKAEIDFAKALERGLVPLVFGEYGVGKTSMARYVLREDEASNRLVNVESVANKSMDDVFAQCLEQLGYTVEIKRTTAVARSSSSDEGGEMTGGFPFLSAKFASKDTKASGATTSTETQLVVTSPTDSKMIQICEAEGLVLLLDELHKADEKFAAELSEFIKAYGNANCQRFRVALLGTSADASKLVKADPGIDRLLTEVRLGALSEPEASYVITTGMRELEIHVDREVEDKLVRTAVGSPSILQYLCLEVAEHAGARYPQVASLLDVAEASAQYVNTKEARLYRIYSQAIETIGPLRYRKQILRAMSEIDTEYATMDDIRDRVSANVGRTIESTALSGPLRDLKQAQYGPVLSDVERPDGSGRVVNYTTFVDPSMKAFVRMQVARDDEGAQGSVKGP